MFASAGTSSETVESTLTRLRAQFTEAGDERGLARAHLAAVQLGWRTCRHTRAADEARLAAEHADKAGEPGLRSRALGWRVGSLLSTPLDPTALTRELDALESEDLGPYVAAFIDVARGDCAAEEGRFDEGRRLIHRAIDGFRALGIPVMAGGCYHQLAMLELWAEDPQAALVGLLESDAELAELSERGFRSTTQALLAHAYELVGDRAAALAAIELAEKLGAPDDALNNAITHAVRARIALADDDGNAAERWARRGAEGTFRTDSLREQATATLELARVLARLGRHDEARTEAQTAFKLYEAKGHRPGAGETRTFLGQLGGRT
jgi:tetratricopeptide (TPR) repeat protein